MSCAILREWFGEFSRAEGGMPSVAVGAQYARCRLLFGGLSRDRAFHPMSVNCSVIARIVYRVSPRPPGVDMERNAHTLLNPNPRRGRMT